MNTVSQPMYKWQDLPWRTIERAVFKLQKRIYQAAKGSTYDKSQMTEEPCDAKGSSTVLKPSGGGDSAT